MAARLAAFSRKQAVSGMVESQKSRMAAHAKAGIPQVGFDRKEEEHTM